MTLTSPFYEWEQALADAGKGPASIYIDRSIPFSAVWSIGANFTGATAKASLRSSPDASGSTLADFTVSSPTVSGGVTTFTVSLSASATAALPADTEGDGVVPLVWDFLLTPSGGTQFRLMGGTAYVSGKVTNA